VASIGVELSRCTPAPDDRAHRSSPR
jgi:hypothetical protein